MTLPVLLACLGSGSSTALSSKRTHVHFTALDARNVLALVLAAFLQERNGLDKCIDERS